MIASPAADDCKPLQLPGGEQRKTSQRRVRQPSLSRTVIERAWRAGGEPLYNSSSALRPEQDEAAEQHPPYRQCNRSVPRCDLTRNSLQNNTPFIATETLVIVEYLRQSRNPQ